MNLVLLEFLTHHSQLLFKKITFLGSRIFIKLKHFNLIITTMKSKRTALTWVSKQPAPKAWTQRLKSDLPEQMAHASASAAADSPLNPGLLSISPVPSPE